MRNQKILGVIAILMMSGCASVDYNPIGACNAYGNAVRILYTAPREGTYKVCGSLSVKGSRFTDSEETMRLFKEQASQYGANAVLIVGELKGDFNWAEGYNKKAKAIAIQLSQ